MRNFVEKAAKATLVGDVFDDAATGQGLLNYFLRAMNCGAMTEEEALKLSGLTVDELRSGSFVKILKNRRVEAGQLTSEARASRLDSRYARCAYTHQS